MLNTKLKQRATHTKSLETRISLNAKYQSRGFTDWLHRRLGVAAGEHILDVGCGTGAQALQFLEAIGPSGTVSALDISADSITTLIERSGHDDRLEAVPADMMDLASVLESSFNQQRFTLAHSSYALYYAESPLRVLQTMADVVAEAGRVAVFTPCEPHGMVEMALRFGPIPELVRESLRFGPDVLEPSFRRLFWDVEVQFFQSEMRVSSVSDFMLFYRATTYFDPSVETEVEEYAKAMVSERGAVTYEKNGYLITGRDRRSDQSIAGAEAKNSG
jgi:ubiquinone/menaquinone biosynthesis C-methylase UbiE